MLGEELKQLRSERRLGAAALARLSGISRPHIYAIESGDAGIPRADTLLKIARGLSAWRGGTPDPDECAEVFRRLEIAAGYPVDAPRATGDGETVTTPIPPPLAGSILEILENWPRWSQVERETAARLLDVASDIGRPDAPTVTHDEPSQTQNGMTEFVSIISRLNQLEPVAPVRSPARELVAAGR